jgi:hypothetical protein
LDAPSPDATSKPEANEMPNFRATSFEEAMKLDNPIPDEVLMEIVSANKDWQGAMLFGSVKPTPEVDAPATAEQKDEFYHRLHDLIKRQEASLGKKAHHTQWGFEQFDTRAYRERRDRGEQIAIDRRIYLNPKQLDMLGIYEELLQMFDDRGFAIKSKMLSAISSTTNDGKPQNEHMDKIVIYTDDEQSDDVLRAVMDIYAKHQESFAGRTTPTPVTAELADGLSVADEPAGFSGRESASSLREKIIKSAYRKMLADYATKKGLGDDVVAANKQMYREYSDDQVIGIYRRYAESALRANDIDPRNWSFGPREPRKPRETIPAGTFDAGEPIPPRVFATPEEEAERDQRIADNREYDALSPEEKMARAIGFFNSLGDQNDVLVDIARSYHGTDDAAWKEKIKQTYGQALNMIKKADGSWLTGLERKMLMLVLSNPDIGVVTPGATPEQPAQPNEQPAQPNEQPAQTAEQTPPPAPPAFAGAPTAPIAMPPNGGGNNGNNQPPTAPNAQPVNPETEQASAALIAARDKYAELMAKKQRNIIPIRWRKKAREELAAAETAYQQAVQGYYSRAIDPSGDETTRTVQFAGAMINEHNALRAEKVDKLMGRGKLRKFVEWWGQASTGKKIAASIVIGAGVGIPMSLLGGGLPAAAALAGVLGGGKAFLNEAGTALKVPPQPNRERSWAELTAMIANNQQTDDAKLFQQVQFDGRVANAQRAIQGRDIDAYVRMIQSMNERFKSGVSAERRRTARNVGVMTGIAVGSSVLFHIGTDVVREGINTGHWPWSGDTATATPTPTTSGTPDMTGMNQTPPPVPDVTPTPAPAPAPEIPVTPDIPSNALNVTYGEGWLQTFREAGLTNTQAWAAVHDSGIMQQFYDNGWAYLRPQDGLAGISHTGQLPAEMLQNVLNKYH